MDTLTVAERSERMARIKSKDTKPELRVRHAQRAADHLHGSLDREGGRAAA